MFVSVPVRSGAPPRWATPLLSVLLWAAFVWALSRPDAWQRALMLEWGALAGGIPGAGPWETWTDPQQWARLVTALFLHADWAHLLGNLVFLLIFGLPAERVMGPWRFLALFFFGGALANLFAVLVIGAPDRLIIGASGAVSAVIGAYLALFPRARLGVVVPLGLFLVGGCLANFVAVLAIGAPDRLIIGASGAVSAVIGAYLALFPGARLGVVLPLGLFLEFVRAPASLLIGIWALLQVVFAYIGPAFGAVAWAAHISGFVFGIVFALLARRGIARRLRKMKGY